MVERKLFTIFFNHLALMEQGSLSMWDAAGFLFCMRDKSSTTLPSGIIIQPLVLFSAIKNCAISVATCSPNCLFFLLTFSGSSASKQEHLLSQTEFRAGRIPT